MSGDCKGAEMGATVGGYVGGCKELIARCS